ncbi:MAG: 4'-phosphopantetheinyl transferase superfamily protein [Clostridia bacterium]|nr:4'-phosphopantetheinyl transferase superfamily protein [Clostridia bacterium]
MISAIYYTRFDCPHPKHSQEYAATAKRYRNQLLDYVFTKHVGKPYSECSIIYGEHSKPYLLDGSLFYNISHTHGMVCCGISDAPIGVDCERLRPISDGLYSATVSREDEALIPCRDRLSVFFTVWTLKESLCKMTGDGLPKDLRSVRLYPSSNGISDGGDARLFIYDDIDGFAVSACCSNGKKPVLMPVY